jgi:hypothetical protein
MNMFDNTKTHQIYEMRMLDNTKLCQIYEMQMLGKTWQHDGVNSIWLASSSSIDRI